MATPHHSSSTASSTATTTTTTTIRYQDSDDQFSQLHRQIIADVSSLTRAPKSMGIALGLLAGYVRGVFEIAVMRTMDVILTLPSLLLAIVIVAILGPGLMNAMLAVAIVCLPHYVRITRAAVIAESGKDYVMAARLSGAGHLRLMLIEILPNCAAPLIVQASLGISTAILDAAALGFLGLGAQPPSPEWGTMLADAREFVVRAWWVVTFPGLAILITVLAFNLLGDGLRDALDPKLKR
jgi:dipeptide transport system permease protein